VGPGGLADQSPEAEEEGGEEDDDDDVPIDELVERLKHGPVASRVSSNSDDYNFLGFRVLYTTYYILA
jgi:hypothetical protein